MDQWTVAFIFISIDSQHFFQGSQASQSPGYIGCYPIIYSADLIVKAVTGFNNSTYCIGVCASYGYRYAATRGGFCKCANETRLSVYKDDAECGFPCPGRLTEHCGGPNGVSMYDTLLPEKISYPECVKDQYGLTALTSEGTNTNIKVFHNNSATLCTSLCKASQYIFSGTKERLCICGNKIKHDIKESSKCESKCPGNAEETCGGEDSVSLRRTGYVKTTTETPRPIEQETSSDNDLTPSSQPTETPRPIEQETSSDNDLTPSSQPTEDDFTDEYTENPLSVFQFTDAVTVSTKTDVNNTIETPNLSRPETSSAVTGTRLIEVTVTNESTGNTSFVFLSTQADTKTSVAKWFQVTAVYIWLPVGIVIGGYVVLTVGLLLRRYKRLKSKASVKRREVSSCHFTLDQGGNILEDDDHYQTIDPEISQYVESSTYKITIDDNCDAGYLTPVGSNDITGYITPIFSK